MFRKFALNGLVAAAIATAPIAVPSASARDNFENFLLGLTAIGIVGAVVHEKNKKDRQRRVRQQPVQDPHPVTRYEQHRHGDVVHKHPHGDRHHRGGHNVHHKHKKHVRKHKKRHHQRLPNECLRQRWTENGWVQFYGKRCLKRYGY